jgi:uncharacterized protein (TIGR04222 family)
MSGPLRFAIVLALLGVCAVLAALVRLRYRPPDDELGRVDLGLYQVACLAGGPRSVAATAITRLVAAGQLQLEGRLLVACATPTGADPVEGTVLSRASGPGFGRSRGRQRPGVHIARVEQAIQADARRLRQGLTDFGLILADRPLRTTRLVTAPIMLIPLLLGSGELLHSLVAGQFEGYFIAPIFMSLVIGAMIVLPEGGRTRRGDRVLARIRSDNAGLASTPSVSLEPDQLALAVAVSGPRILAGGPLAPLGRILEQAQSSDSMD